MINKSIDATKKDKIINRANLCKPKQEKKKAYCIYPCNSMVLHTPASNQNPEFCFLSIELVTIAF